MQRRVRIACEVTIEIWGLGFLQGITATTGIDPDTVHDDENDRLAWCAIDCRHRVPDVLILRIDLITQSTPLL
jgi:hypothetical protein